MTRTPSSPSSSRIGLASIARQQAGQRVGELQGVEGCRRGALRGRHLADVGRAARRAAAGPLPSARHRRGMRCRARTAAMPVDVVADERGQRLERLGFLAADRRQGVHRRPADAVLGRSAADDVERRLRSAAGQLVCSNTTLRAPSSTSSVKPSSRLPRSPSVRL